MTIKMILCSFTCFQMSRLTEQQILEHLDKDGDDEEEEAYAPGSESSESEDDNPREGMVPVS